MKIQDVMSLAFDLAGPEVTLRAAAERLLEGTTEALIVLSDDRVQGCLGLADLLTVGSRSEGGSKTTGQRRSNHPALGWPDQRLVDLLPTDVYLVTGETPLMAAAALLTQAQLHCLAVVVDGRPAGVVGWRHLARGLLAAMR